MRATFYPLLQCRKRMERRHLELVAVDAIRVASQSGVNRFAPIGPFLKEGLVGVESKFWCTPLSSASPILTQEK